MALGQALADAVLDQVFGKTTYTPVNTIYVAASTTTPDSVGGSVTEPVGGSYARVAVTNNTSNFPNASGGVKTTGADIIFPEASGDWGTITYLAFYDASSSGNFLFAAALTAAKTIGTGDTLRIASGALTINL